jgi:putative proteasome-type protease
MTYGLGMLLDAGLVLIADTRTNAGVDNFSSYRKLHCLKRGPDREIYVACSGNLSASQNALGLLLEREAPGYGSAETLEDATSMYTVARLIGAAVREANRECREALGEERKAGTCMLLGGSIGTSPPRLFLIYEQGNFIECKDEAPFLQIGETKYGRPILDRTIKRSTPLAAAVKIGLLSFDSAMRSNLAVARPLDLMVMPTDPAETTFMTRIEKDDPYFNDLSARWSELLVEATFLVPDPLFMSPGDAGRPLSVVGGKG